MSRAGSVTRVPVALFLTGLLLSFVAGCGSAEDSGSDNGSKPGQVAAATPAATAQDRAEGRREARQARERSRKAARKARAVERRIRVRARALARRGGDVDCGAFVSQARAQLYLLNGDPFGLDGDGDGITCAELPCPCSVEAGGEPEVAGDSGTLSEPPRRFNGTVTDVADGDTLDVSTPAGAVETIRIIGIDTPEVYGGRECGGPAASAAMKRLATGQQVRVISDPTQDRRDHYGRLLAYVDKGSQDLGLTLVKRGLASAYPYDGPFQRYPVYAKADQQARNQNRGSWANCDISPG